MRCILAREMIMPVYRCEPGTELTGLTFLSFFTNIHHEVIRPYLDRYGLKGVDPQGWYPLQLALDILTDISADIDSSMNLVAIGAAAAEVSPIPPDVQCLPFEQFLLLYEKLYPARHRNGDPGWVRVEQLGPHHVKMILNVPYPDDIFYGLFYGFSRRFLAAGVPRTIEYDEDLPTKDQGGDVTVIHVHWGR